MFFRKKQRETDKLIMQNAKYSAIFADEAVIDVKITSAEQIFSPYSYSGDKLNTEFSDFVFEQVKRAPLSESLTLKIHTNEFIDCAEVEKSLKNHCAAEYIEAKKQLKRTSVISIIMTLLGILALTVFILLNKFWDNFYVDTIVEIAAWVFIWEAVDYFFLQRPLIKGKCLLIQRIFNSKTEICIVN